MITQKLFLIQLLLLLFLTASCSDKAFRQSSSEITGEELFILNLAENSMSFRDPEDNYSPEEVLKLSPDSFIKNAGSLFIMGGIQKGSYWTRFQIKKKLPEGPLYLELNQPSVDLYELFYRKESNDIYFSEKTGVLHYPSPHTYISRMHTIQLPEDTDLSHPFYIRVKNENDISYMPTLYNAKAFQRHLQYEIYFFGAVIGILISMFFYNLFLYISLKEKSYLYYVFYLAATTIYVLATWGIFAALAPEFAYWQRPIHWISVGFITVTASLFSKEFLHLSRLSKLLNTALLLLIVSGSVMIILGISGLYLYASILSKVNGFLIFPAIIASGVVSYRRGNKSALYFMLGWGILALSYVILTLKTMGIVSEIFFSPKTTPLATCLEAMFLSLALADRIKVLNREKIQSQKIISDMKEKETERLEKIVQKRTKELAEANAAKDRFFSILAHDLRNPIGNMTTFLDLAREKNKMPADDKIEMMYRNSKRVYDLLDDLLEWGRTQKGQIDFNPVSFDAAEKAYEIFSSFFDQASSKEIDMKCSFKSEQKIICFADPGMTGAILRNLISNALKFTERGGSITMSAVSSGVSILFTISDTGIGFDLQKADGIFQIGSSNVSTYGTENERGSGFGLVLSKELVELNGGSIGCRSVPGKGSNFWFTLPSGAV